MLNIDYIIKNYLEDIRNVNNLYENKYYDYYLKEKDIMIYLNPLTSGIYYYSNKTNKKIIPNVLLDETGYFIISICGKRYKLHDLMAFKFLNFKKESGLIIDHINNHRWDCRVSNLRIANLKDNSRNRQVSKNASSRYKGVSWNKAKRKWVVFITINNKRKYLGSFRCEREAALKYNKVALSLGYKDYEINKIDDEDFFVNSKKEQGTNVTLSSEDLGNWKKIIVNNKEIEVSDLGFVKYFNKKLNKDIISDGHKHTCDGERRYPKIKINGKHEFIHRLVAHAFLNYSLDDKIRIVDHINNDIFDNRLVNLRVTTKSNNSKNKKGKLERLRLLDVVEMFESVL